MNKTIRARIAAAINDALPWDGPNLSDRLADAVIRELNLTESFGVIIGCNHEDHHG